MPESAFGLVPMSVDATAYPCCTGQMKIEGVYISRGAAIAEAQKTAIPFRLFRKPDLDMDVGSFGWMQKKFHHSPGREVLVFPTIWINENGIGRRIRLEEFPVFEFQ